MSRIKVSATLAATLMREAVGLPVSHAWRGHGSAVFLELGKLRNVRASNRRHLPSWKGAMTVMVEWSWRVERARSIEGGSWSSESRIDRIVASLKGSRVAAIQLEGRLPELSIALTGSRWVRSFMTAEGQPAWAVFLSDQSWLTVARGVAIHDTQNQRSSARGGRGAT